MVDRSKERDKSSLGYFNESSRREIAGKNGSGRELGGGQGQGHEYEREQRGQEGRCAEESLGV